MNDKFVRAYRYFVERCNYGKKNNCDVINGFTYRSLSEAPFPSLIACL